MTKRLESAVRLALSIATLADPLRTFGQAAPDVISFCPSAVAAGSRELELTITGTGFTNNSEVRWSAGAAAEVLAILGRDTTGQFTTLRVLVPARLLTQPVAATISVVNTVLATTIESFLPATSTVGPSGDATLTCIARNAQRIVISRSNPQTNSRDIEAQSDDVAPQDRTTFAASAHPPFTSTYFCTATSPNGGSDERQVTVNVPAPTFTVSGTITPLPAGSGVTVTLSGTDTRTATSDGFGNYSFAGLANGTYTFTPSKTGFIFLPANRTATVNNANTVGVDFSASAPIVPPSATPNVPARSPVPRATSDNRRDANPIQFLVLARPSITSIVPSPISEGADVSVAIQGSNFIPSSGGCAVGSKLRWNGVDVSATVESATRITATIPATLLQPANARVEVVSPVNIVSDPASVTVNLAPIILTSTLPDGVVGRPYRSTQILAAGGTSPLQFSIVSNMGLTISSTGVITGVPTQDGFFDVAVSAADASQRSTRNVYRVRILPIVNVSLGGLAPSIAITENPMVQVSIPEAYPGLIEGTLGLSFAKDPLVAGAADLRDPTLQLSTDSFRIPPGATSVRVPLQPGTVAGTITVNLTRLSVEVIDVDPGTVQTVTRIAPAPPSFSACIEQQFAGLLRLRMTGISATRNIIRATFQFAGAPGQDLQPASLEVTGTSALFDAFYSPPAGAAPGFGAFVYTQDFLIDGDVNQIRSVSVVLQNAGGASAPVLAAGSCV